MRIPAHRRPKIKAVSSVIGALALVMGGFAVVANTTAPDQVPVAETPVTFMGAGDIASSGSSTMANATATGNLIREANPDHVFTTGDNAYDDGSLSQYQTQYEPTWGSFKAKTYPVPGNHEYHSDPPQGYIDYFGSAKVRNSQDNGLYYAKDLGNGWRAYFLNYYVSYSSTSAQMTWLQADLAANAGKHIIGVFHRPRYNQGSVHGSSTGPCAFWNALQNAKADIILTGHDHTYQRFAKMDCNATAKADGIRQFVVGSGGNQLYGLGTSSPAPEAKNNSDYGVLKLSLYSNSYDWQFIASGRGWNGSTSVDTGRKGQILDSGTAATNVTVAAPTPTTEPTPTATTTPTVSPTPTTPPPPTGTPPLHYANNPDGQYAELASLGYNLMDTGMSASTINGLPAGSKALVWTDEGDCPAATPSAAFTSFVDANATNPKVYGYYLADEPQSTSASCVNAIKARADYIHSKNPNQKALVLLTDYPGTYAAYSPASAHVDLVGLDPYPCRWDIGTSGGCDYTMIETELAAAQAAGIPLSSIVPMFQVFGDDHTWKPPTVAELQNILAEWQEHLPDPAIDMTYTWGIQPEWGHTDTLQTRPDWQDVMVAYIDGLAATPTPTPTTTTSPTPTTDPTPTTTTDPTPTTDPSPTPTAGTPATRLECPVTASPQVGDTVTCTYR